MNVWTLFVCNILMEFEAVARNNIITKGFVLQIEKAHTKMVNADKMQVFLKFTKYHYLITWHCSLIIKNQQSTADEWELKMLIILL